ncbi:hypothetical protein CEXT_587171 [Caerostris extrusa]|uniref:Uncharacterized protein n=1 Tax=Caerostris extrusa TaxID=172846 RepID=A0AAV4YFH0_CAEEX|nr:hypothetical protein CEXT_587171 [Caerostris extrusa]
MGDGRHTQSSPTHPRLLLLVLYFNHSYQVEAFSSSHVDLNSEQKIKLSSPDISIQLKKYPMMYGNCSGVSSQRGDVAVKYSSLPHPHPTHFADFEVCLMDSLMSVRDNHILITAYEIYQIEAFSSSRVDLHSEQKIKLSSPDISIQFQKVPNDVWDFNGVSSKRRRCC